MNSGMITRALTVVGRSTVKAEEIPIRILQVELLHAVPRYSRGRHVDPIRSHVNVGRVHVWTSKLQVRVFVRCDVARIRFGGRWSPSYAVFSISSDRSARRRTGSATSRD